MSAYIPLAWRCLDVCSATWPAAQTWSEHPLTLRDGAGGGKRVSAATLEPGWSARHIDGAEADMQARGMAPLFMVRPEQPELDEALTARGYDLLDPTGVLVRSLSRLAARPVERLSTFAVWPPLEIMADLWAQGGVGPDRLAVMSRAKGPATGILARTDDRPSGVAFAAIHQSVAMVHALEVRPEFRRRKVAVNIMRAAACWAQDHGAREMAVLCVRHNSAANALYSYLGFNRVGSYHYRQLKP